MAEHDALRQSTSPPRDAGADALRAEANYREHTSVLKEGLAKMAGMVTSDTETQRTIAEYGAAGLKTAALFVRGPVGLAATVGLFGVDEANPYDMGDGHMVAGFGMGAAKGVVDRFVFSKVGEQSWNPAMKAMSLGIGSRMTDGLFDGRSFHNANGDFTPVSGLTRAMGSAFDFRSLGTDVATFGLTYGLFKGADRVTSGGLSASRIGATAFMGGTYGLISGAHGELRNQIDSGSGMDFGKVAWKGLTLGAVDAVAAIPGGMQAHARLTPPENWSESQLSQIRAAAKANGLWMLEMPKPILAADNTPIVMAYKNHMSMDSTLVAASKMAGRLGHPVTLDWNEVRFRVEPNATRTQMHEAYQTAMHDPARQIEALRGKPAREPEVLMRNLATQSKFTGSDWTTLGMYQLRHPSEIEAFGRAYARFDTHNAVTKMRAADGVQAGTQNVWKQVADRIAKNGAGQPNAGEDKLFTELRARQS